MIEIGNADDERLADYRLLNDVAARRQHESDEFFIAEGYIAIDRVIDSGHRLRSVVLTPSRVARFEDHLPALEAAGVPVYVVPKEILADTVGFGLHRGVIASADRKPIPHVEDVCRRADRIAVLEGLNDPENVGAIARAARAFGIGALVLDPTCTDPYSRRAVRVSMGEILSMPIARSPIGAALDAMHGAGFETWATSPAEDTDDLWRLDVPERLAVVLGAEGPGLPDVTLRAAHRRVRVPIDPDVDSLNVAQAAAITFAAIGRPRG